MIPFLVEFYKRDHINADILTVLLLLMRDAKYPPFTASEIYARLPSFEEWEIASRAGARSRYFWGDDDANIGQYANVWHGHDHLVADSSDGYMYTAPVGSFKPNGFGLYDVYGNVFEFCDGHLGNEQAVHARGGSWWCSLHACSYFNSVEIGRVHPHASFSNQGFRVVKL